MKLEVASIVLSAVSVAGVLVAVSEARSASSGIVALTDRVAKIESAFPSSAASVNGPSNADLAREIALLRAQASKAPPLSFAPTRKDPVVKAPLDPAAAAEAAAKAKVDEEKRQQAWIDGLSTGIVKSLTEKLELSAQQQLQVSDLVRNQIVTYRQDSRGTSTEEQKKALETLYADTNEKMKQLLTLEQRSKYEEIAKRPGGIFTFPIATPSRPPESGEGSHSEPK